MLIAVIAARLGNAVYHSRRLHSVADSDHGHYAVSSHSVGIDVARRKAPAGDRIKFIAISTMKPGKTLVIARQEWAGRLGDCGEGKLADAKQASFDDALASNVRKAGVSEET